MPPWYACRVAVMGLALGLSLACGKATGVPEDGSAVTAGSQEIPFDRETHPDGTTSRVPQEHAIDRLPEGTPVTVRLLKPVSSAFSHAGDSFEGTLDDPIAIQEQVAVPRGARVTGRVLAAKSAGQLHDPGYLRIAVVSVTIHGLRFPVSTSSLFVKGGTHEKRDRNPGGGGSAAPAVVPATDDVSFTTERRLTFRLTQAVEFQ